MTFEDCIKSLENGEPVFDIGQISKQTRGRLDRLAKKGKIIKDTEALWPWITHGTIKKTVFLPK
jgi:hypothetical protein